MKKYYVKESNVSLEFGDVLGGKWEMEFTPDTVKTLIDGGIIVERGDEEDEEESHTPDPLTSEEIDEMLVSLFDTDEELTERVEKLEQEIAELKIEIKRLQKVK